MLWLVKSFLNSCYLSFKPRSNHLILMQKSWLQSLQPRSKGWILSELVCWLPCYAGAVTLNLERKRPVSSCIQFMMFQKVLWFMFASCLWRNNLCMQTSCHRATNLLVMDTFANVLVLYKTLFIILDKYFISVTWVNRKSRVTYILTTGHYRSLTVRSP